MLDLVLAAALTIGTQGQIGMIDSELDACLAAQPRTSDAVDYLTRCYTSAQARADMEVLREQDRMVRKLSGAKLATAPAIAAQAAWLRYRDQWCRIEGEGEPDQFARDLTALQCRVEVTQRRLFRMKSAYQRPAQR